MKVRVRCPGKVILFGEHACVYGFPSLVTTIDAHTQVCHEGRGLLCFRGKRQEVDLSLQVEGVGGGFSVSGLGCGLVCLEGKKYYNLDPPPS